MQRLPSDVSQGRVVRALILAGGVEVRGLGKGSHRSVKMPNIARPVTVPTHLGPILLRGIARQAGLTIQQLAELL